jgi:hypothetical protein
MPSDLVARARADDDAEEARGPISGPSRKQPTAPDKPGSSPLNRREGRGADGDDDKARKADDGKGRKVGDDQEPTLQAVMDSLKDLHKRLDDIEGREADGPSR